MYLSRTLPAEMPKAGQRLQPGGVVGPVDSRCRPAEPHKSNAKILTGA